MRYQDIPQLTSLSGYQVNVSLKYLEQTLSDYAESNVQLTPDFQRGHVWTEKQQIAFVEYLFRGGKSGRDLYFNHPNWQKGSLDQGDFVLVDGLQRITACLRFLHNEIPIFGHYRKDIEGKMPYDVDLIVHVNDLQTRQEVLKWYLEMNSGGTPHSQEELERVAQLYEDAVENNL